MILKLTRGSYCAYKPKGAHGAMASIAYYRAEAERCRILADGSKDPAAVDRWRALARDYNAMADEFERAQSRPPPVMHVPMQQQPVQQQQTQTKPKEADANADAEEAASLVMRMARPSGTPQE